MDINKLKIVVNIVQKVVKTLCFTFGIDGIPTSSPKAI